MRRGTFHRIGADPAGVVLTWPALDGRPARAAVAWPRSREEAQRWRSTQQATTCASSARIGA
jgi:hypothetical protein